MSTNQPTWLNRTVVGTGITSALGDFCYETTTVILPGFFAVLGLPASALGSIEGFADAVASYTKMVSGYIADKLGYRKALVLIGYALTPIGQALIALASGWGLILAGRTISWFGKGLRGPLRDAIVIQAVSPETKGRAFGFHRATDTIGAVIGPLLGVFLLGSIQSWHLSDESTAFRVVLWLSMIPGVLAVLTFFLLVHDPGFSPNPALRFVSTIKGLPSRFKRYLLAVGVFAAGDFSHSLLILAVTQLLTASMGIVQSAQVAGLLYVWRNIVQVAVSFPAGMFADRFGHLRTLTIGYILGILTAGMTAFAFVIGTESIAMCMLIFTLAGAYMAVQDAIEPTALAEMVSQDTLTTSIGALGSVNGTAKFVSSSLVGILWSAVSPTFAFVVATVLMATGTILLNTTKKA